MEVVTQMHGEATVRDDAAETFYVDGTAYTWDASFPLAGISFTAASPWVNASPSVNVSPWLNSIA